MTIETKKINNPNSGYKNTISKSNLDITEQLNALNKKTQEQIAQARNSELALLKDVEKLHFDNLVDKGMDILEENEEAYFQVIGENNYKGLDDITRTTLKKQILSIINTIAENISRKHLSIENKQAELLTRLNPEILKTEYIKAKAYLDKLMDTAEREYAESNGLSSKSSNNTFVINSKPFDPSKLQNDAAINHAIDNGLINKNSQVNSTNGILAGAVGLGLGSQGKTFNNGIKTENKQEITIKETPTTDFGKTFDTLKTQSGISSEDQKILGKLKANIDTNTGKLKNEVSLGEGNELKLSPDGKKIILSGLGFKYEYSNPLDGESLTNVFNKTSSIIFLDKTGITCLGEKNIRNMFFNINKFNTAGIQLNIDKKDGLTSIERLIILATLKKLDLINSYDPTDLSKRIGNKQDFENKLNTKTNFYKNGVYSSFNFENTIAAIAKKSTKNEGEKVFA
ncbi:MAG: hypothetical protein PHZ26_03105 [Candidatus Gracilibacteria bacterium]|nr:hypothetical protein [Candidatus Gracilibacteria bacterium]MDD2908716.1 hypothetical protein [Candidatus Gracilibacteria bacterium]